MCPKETAAAIRATVAAIASRQFGVISHEQLIAAGLSPSGVRNWVRAKRLFRIHQGVYSVGHEALSNEGRWMAAVLACGEGTVLSHRSAAEHWRMLGPLSGPVHVTVPGERRRRRRGIVAHRSASLSRKVMTVHTRIPITTPARTLTDLQQTAPSDQFRRALRQAEFLGLSVADVVSDGAENDFEAAFLALCRRYRLPMPDVDVKIGPYRVDFLWPRAMLIVETDGWQSHRGRIAFQEDRERDLYLKVRGFEVIRLSYVQVTQRAVEVAAALRQLLGDRGRAISGN